MNKPTLNEVLAHYNEHKPNNFTEVEKSNKLQEYYKEVGVDYLYEIGFFQYLEDEERKNDLEGDFDWIQSIGHRVAEFFGEEPRKE
jgi:hypothetical protein